MRYPQEFGFELAQNGGWPFNQAIDFFQLGLRYIGLLAGCRRCNADLPDYPISTLGWINQDLMGAQQVDIRFRIGDIEGLRMMKPVPPGRASGL